MKTPVKESSSKATSVPGGASGAATTETAGQGVEGVKNKTRKRKKSQTGSKQGDRKVKKKKGVFIL